MRQDSRLQAESTKTFSNPILTLNGLISFHSSIVGYANCNVPRIIGRAGHVRTFMLDMSNALGESTATLVGAILPEQVGS
jgi:hypothetical protein